MLRPEQASLNTRPSREMWNWLTSSRSMKVSGRAVLSIELLTMQELGSERGASWNQVLISEDPREGTSPWEMMLEALASEF